MPPATNVLAAELRRRESDALVRIQSSAAGEAYVPVARALSLAGEHAAGWIVLGLSGAVIDRRRRRAWLRATGAVVVAHAAAVGVKRVVRRRRPDDERIDIRGSAPSSLSFPSSHATSTTAAAVALGPLLGVPRAALALPVAMAAARTTLGMHFPTDVAVGAALGAAIGALGRSAGQHAASHP